MTTPDRFARIAELFERVRTMDLATRRRVLDESCASDDDLRAEVESLLDEHDRASPLDAPAKGVEEAQAMVAKVEPRTERLPKTLGRYRIIRRIGSGGMGAVYEAEQENPTRSVAVKVIRTGLDTDQVAARFETERQALAMMDHPSIAKVFDAGVSDDGRPFFAMELVHGVPITEYCQTRDLGTRDRIELFLSVCGAIQHAHQKGVIHRDIKPSNVLVADLDGQPVAKVIDFGIAKAAEGDLAGSTIVTRQGQMIGTPRYMSPEQVSTDDAGVDTRADIYALGVLLYELLTGTTPFGDDDLASGGIAGLVRVICDQEPERPSTRLSDRPTSETRVTASDLEGDLDWIVMKCLEKERGLRYDSASGLADDLRRALDDEPIVARPHTARYRLTKFVRRNRGRVVATVALFAILALGMAGTIGGLLWALDERDRASIAAIEARAATDAARESEDAARTEADIAEALSRFFVLDVLSAVDPSRTEDRDITVREALRLASARIAGRFEGKPRVEGRIHNALAYLFDRLGLPAEAEPHFRREWELAVQTDGETSLESARLMHGIARVLATLGRYEEAIETTRRQLEILDLHDSAEAAEWRVRARGNLGALLFMRGHLEEAIPYLETTLESKRAGLGDRHVSTLASIANLAAAYNTIGRHQAASHLAREAYEGRLDVLGEGDPRTYDALSTFARAETMMGRDEEAAELLGAAASQARERLGPAHPVVVGMGALEANILRRLDRFDEAESRYQELLGHIPTFDPDRDLQLSVQIESGYASLLRDTERAERALEIFENSMDVARRVHPAKSIELAIHLREYARTLSVLDRFDDAENAFMESWACLDDTDDHRAERRRTGEAIVEHFERRHHSEPDAGYDERAATWSSRFE